MMAPMRQRGVEIFGVQPSVDHWEIAVLHRDSMSGEGACIRCTWLSMDAAGLTHAIDTKRLATLPALEEMDGFCSASLMVDRARVARSLLPLAYGPVRADRRSLAMARGRC